MFDGGSLKGRKWLLKRPLSNLKHKPDERNRFVVSIPRPANDNKFDNRTFIKLKLLLASAAVMGLLVLAYLNSQRLF